ncbi:MAG: AraC family transcriptional regulator [Pseudomonadota bacterium]|nr:AraC family transcriptional regulator [Pseudomonadota bacterium]
MPDDRLCEAEQLCDRFRLVGLSDLDELESGVYWPKLQPFFLKPSFRRLTYRLNSLPSQDVAKNSILSRRGASGAGELDVAYIADHCAATLLITETGLPDYCLTFVRRGVLTCSGLDSPDLFNAGKGVGLIYRGLPGTALAATSDHERVAIWIPAESVRQRLVAMLGGPMQEDVTFDPLFDLDTRGGRKIRSLVSHLMGELSPDRSFSGNNLACRSFTDLLIYAMLEGVPNSYSKRLDPHSASPVPGIIRRAEEYIRSHSEQPITLTDLAAAAGCSVRNLQIGFRRFRDTTPANAILLARLESLRQGIVRGRVNGTVTEIAYQYGFTNPGRLTALCKAAFGTSLTDMLRQHRTEVSQR